MTPQQYQERINELEVQLAGERRSGTAARQRVTILERRVALLEASTRLAWQLAVNGPPARRQDKPDEVTQ